MSLTIFFSRLASLSTVSFALAMGVPPAIAQAQEPNPSPIPSPTASPLASPSPVPTNDEADSVEITDLTESAEIVEISESNEITEPSEPGASGEPSDNTVEDSGEELDLIPLPEDIAGDASMIDLTTDDTIFSDGDIPPMEIPTALPSVPIGEPARVLAARYKELQIKTKKDPALVSLWEKAQEVPTFEERRAALREYYRTLAQKMRDADKSLTARINAMERAYLQRLEQNRIEPTIPLTPPPTPEPLTAPSPSPAQSS